MAIDVETLQRSGHGFAVNASSADATGCEELLAAPGAGRFIVLEGLLVNTAAALSVTIGGGANAGAVVAPIVGPLAMAANSTVAYRFAEPITLSVNTALVVDASGAGAICILAEGYLL